MQFTGHALIQIPQSLHVSLAEALSSLPRESAYTGHKLTHPPHPVQIFVSMVTIFFSFHSELPVRKINACTDVDGDCYTSFLLDGNEFLSSFFMF